MAAIRRASDHSSRSVSCRFSLCGTSRRGLGSFGAVEPFFVSVVGARADCLMLEKGR